MAKTSAKGGFHLLWGIAASTIITSIGVIVLARLLSPVDFGLYSIALTVPNLIQIFRDWGTSYAVVKYTAKYTSEGNYRKVKTIIFSGLLFQTILALVLCLITFLLSEFLALNLFQRPELTFLLQIVSLSLLSGSFISLIQTIAGTSTSLAQAAFIGMERSEYHSLSLLIHSIIRTIITSLLVILGLGSFGAVFGYTISLLLAGLCALLLFFFVYSKLPKVPIKEMKIIANLKILFHYGLPLSLVTILRGFLNQFYIIILAVFASNSLLGNYSVALNFVVLITFFATPVKTVLFPAFSKLDPTKESKDFKNVFRFSVKYGALLVVPVTFLVISLSQPAVYTLFGVNYDSAPTYLSLLSIPYLYSAFGFLSVTNLLNGQGKTKLNLKLTIITASIGFCLGYILTSQLEVFGLIITILVAEIPSLIIGLYWVIKNYGVTVDWSSSLKILASSGLSSLLTYFSISQLLISSWIKLILGTFIFTVLFLLGSIILRTINNEDLNNLREMVKGLGPLSSIIVFVLNLYEKTQKFLKIQ
jgi:O-antigen/teichoic acid export membrane protein